ncbi:hypothetical protein HID58_075868 [Brassica napus]|uniref:Uncharacterized protein n=1 Tax=Brassica napus TaxID=3708 RepID=A0ABQ7YL30_BRANA|nr:hypothetical protein HID58_075868 [Brassica napus]
MGGAYSLLHGLPVHNSPDHSSSVHSSRYNSSPVHMSPDHMSPDYNSPIHRSPAHNSPVHMLPIKSNIFPKQDALIVSNSSVSREDLWEAVVRFVVSYKNMKKLGP